jgi:ElaB/YqjD/DUF883 family membrane-anchored ribosome-binding protein
MPESAPPLLARATRIAEASPLSSEARVRTLLMPWSTMKRQKKRSNRIASARGDVSDRLSVIGDDLRTLGKQVRQGATRQLHAVGDRVKDAGENFGEVVRENPYRSLLIAAGVGTVVGLLFWRR